MPLQVEWDPERARTNRDKHGVSFEEAASAFLDSLSLTIPDPDRSKRRVQVCRSGNQHDRQVACGFPPRAIRTHPDHRRQEYNFEGGVRGKQAAHLAEGGNVVVLDPDVAREFSTSPGVNDVLRALLPLLTGKRSQRRKKESE